MSAAKEPGGDSRAALEEAAVRVTKHKRSKRAETGWDKSPDQRAMRVLLMHKPKSTARESVRVFPNGRTVTLSCRIEEPEAVHAKRRFDALLNDIERRVACGEVPPDDIVFICSEFFYYRHAKHTRLVLESGAKPITADDYTIDYAAQTIEFITLEKFSETESLTLSPRRFAVLAYYLWKMPPTPVDWLE